MNYDKQINLICSVDDGWPGVVWDIDGNPPGSGVTDCPGDYQNECSQLTYNALPTSGKCRVTFKCTSRKSGKSTSMTVQIQGVASIRG